MLRQLRRRHEINIYDNRSWELAKGELLDASAPKLKLLKVVPLAGRTADAMLEPFRCKVCDVVEHLNSNFNCAECQDNLQILEEFSAELLGQDNVSGEPDPKRQRT